jgi:3-oxoacyl-[acyl-carrier-protein] synthase II
MQRRVAITGIGVVSPLGNDVETMFARLTAGDSAIRRLELPRCEYLRCPLGAPADFDGGTLFDGVKLRLLDRASQMALVAATQAVTGSGVDFADEDRARCGASVGSSLGGAQTTDEAYFNLYGQRSDRVQPLNVVAAMCNAPAAWIAIEWELAGPSLTYSTACSSSAVAIGEAARRIQCGDADLMLAGGTEAPLVPGVLRAWDAMRTLATPDPLHPAASCRPFALNRSGLVIGEGAAFVMLEEWEHAKRRGALIHAELAGYGLTNDPSHITRPSIAGQASAMRAALRSARLEPQAIDYINAHGTATQQNDVVETGAIKEVFALHAPHVPVSSTKSMHGHLLGAAGALEFVIAIAALKQGHIPPTMHLDIPDPACDLDYVPGKARSCAGIRTVMSNSFAFGGTNAVLVASR